MFWKALTKLLRIYQTHLARRYRVFMKPKDEMMKKVTFHADGPVLYRDMSNSREGHRKIP